MRILFLLILSFSMITGIFAVTEPTVFLEKAKTFYDKKNYKEADKVLKEAIVEYPTDASIIKLYATNLLKLAKYKESYLALQKIIIVDGIYTKTDQELYELQISNIKYMQQKKITIPSVDLNEELKINQDMLSSFSNLTDSNEIYKIGNELMKVQKYDKALQTFEMDKSGDIRNIFGAAVTSRFLGFYNKSIENYLLVLEKKPDFTEANLGLAQAYQLNKNYEKAIEYFNYYLAIKPVERVYVVVANIYVFLGDLKSAQLKLDEGQSYFPESKSIGDLLKNVNKKLGQ